MKTCRACKVEKSKLAFGKLARAKDGLQTNCKACNAAYEAGYRSANMEKKKANDAAYRESNREKLRKRNSEWRASNPEKSRASWTLWRSENTQKANASTAAWRDANRVRISEYNATYKSANQEIVSAYLRNRSARKRNAEGNHTASDIRAIFEKQCGLCASCKTNLSEPGSRTYHVDHIMPLKLGGSNWPSNLQCLCPSCNLRKSAKHPDDWAKEISDDRSA